MKLHRQRSQMGALDIAAMLRPLIQKKAWVRYVQTRSAKLDAPSMVKCDYIIGQLAARQPKFSFKKKKRPCNMPLR